MQMEACRTRLVRSSLANRVTTRTTFAGGLEWTHPLIHLFCCRSPYSVATHTPVAVAGRPLPLGGEYKLRLGSRQAQVCGQERTDAALVLRGCEGVQVDVRRAVEQPQFLRPRQRIIDAARLRGRRVQVDGA